MTIIEQIKDQIPEDLDERVEFINNLRYELHLLSPFRDNPVDYVRWTKGENVVANDYNPNKVATPEFELLEVSIMNDGYTQPIVTWPNSDGKTEVIDGFHRNRVGKESKLINSRIHGYLPVVDIRKEQSDKNDRIASTIRHNRARGKHQISAMSEIVIELKNRNWTNQRISKQLGMDEEEVLRLCQISGLENLFTDRDFSRAWEANADFEFSPITDEVSELMDQYKIPNEGADRIFHTYDKWECHQSGFYQTKRKDWTDEMCNAEYVRVLSNPDLFDSILEKVTSKWTHSCEHYLTNRSMNRIAWLGQAAVCYESGVPAIYSSAWDLLTEDQKEKANAVALKHLNKWLLEHDREPVEYDEAILIDRQVELY